MSVPFFIVNAFAKNSFSGNPTGVCILEDWLSTDDLQEISAQTKMPETVFLFPSDSKVWSIRWFSPLSEKDLSGHGTLAAAHILFSEGFEAGKDFLSFSSSGGHLTVTKKESGLLRLEMTSLKARSCLASPLLIEGLGAYPDETFLGMDCLCVFSDESIVRELKPEPKLLKRINCARGIIVTAKSSKPKVDYVTRFFAPRIGVDEDEVTGSIHGLLVPYWSKKLSKQKMHAEQLSSRGTLLSCGLTKGFVWVDGSMETFLRGEISL